MTVGDETQVKRPRMPAEKRARLGAEAWRLKDREGMSYRTIADRFTKRGDEIGHVQIMRLIKEARANAEWLDLIEPAEIRAGQLGRFDTYIEKQMAQMQAGTLEPKHGWALIIAVERLMMQVGGSAMPNRTQIETVGDGPVPNMATLREFANALDEYDRRKSEIQNNDGLNEFDR